MKKQKIEQLLNRPLMELLFEAALIHRKHFNPNEIQCSTLMSIKTGACPEDCKYCSQSGHYKTNIDKEKLVSLESVLQQAQQAKASGASRFCMGAAWRAIPKKNLPDLVSMVKAVKDLGLETCMTLGKLDPTDAEQLKQAGLDYYNHNLDTSKEYYPEVITTRSYEDRLQTLAHVREVGIKVCCGGIIGLGEAQHDRASLIEELSEMDPMPESVPINRLVAMPGTPFEDKVQIDDIDFVKTIAVARIALPKTFIRLSAGRESMSEAMQALCFFAGANSIFYGEKLLTAPNQTQGEDQKLFAKLGLTAMQLAEKSDVCCVAE